MDLTTGQQKSPEERVIIGEGFSKSELEALADYSRHLGEVIEKWATRGIYQVVGNGKITDDNPESPKQCGRYYGNVGCVHVENHDITTLDGVNHKGMAYVKKRFRRCFNPRCPKCVKAWAVREAKAAAWRVTEASKKLGKIEHIIASVPKFEYAMFDEGYDGYLKARAHVGVILESRGVNGGGLIFHGFRFADHREARVKGVPFGWYWSPHWHIVGFLTDGYSMCRRCVHNNGADRDFCRDCRKGFEGRTRRAFDHDGWIVKVKEERKTVVGTFYYQLNHSTIIPSKERFHSLTWFGTVSYRNMKLNKSLYQENPDLCPICGKQCVPLTYLGFDKARLEKEFWIKDFEEPAFDKEGMPVWVEKALSASGGSKRWR
jgi:hypothetical protein